MNRLATLLLLSSLLAPSAKAESWLTYDRSGGITGWSLKIAVDQEGGVSVVGTRQDPKERARVPMSAKELSELRGLVKIALAAPPRKPLGELRHLADGMQRLVTVQDEGEGRLLVLSDGYRPAEGDRDLIAALEALARREPNGEPVASPTPSKPAKERPQALDLVVVGASDPVASNATALLLELPFGRAHEPEGRAGTIELLLLGIIGAQSEVLLDGGPVVDDPDTGRWSLSVTAARTRLLVVLEDLPPAALRDTSARLRRLLQRAAPTLEQVGFVELDHHRRRLADAVHDRARDPRARRLAAARHAAWGARAGASPNAFSVSAIERQDLRDMAERTRKGHARLLAAGPLARRAVSLCSRGFERRARAPLPALNGEPGLDGPGAPTNEQLFVAPAHEVSQGLAGSLALELARRRQGSVWVERLEPGSSHLAIPGDTLMLVAPGGKALRSDAGQRIRHALTRLALGLSQAAVDQRLRRRILSGRGQANAVRLVREAADMLELGVPHPGSASFDGAGHLQSAAAAEVRAAAAALSDSLSDVPSEPAVRERPRSLARAVWTTLGTEPSALEVKGSRDGATLSLKAEMNSSLPLRLRRGSELIDFNAGVLTAGSSVAAGREQALAVELLADPAILLAGAGLGLFPARETQRESLKADGKRRRCQVLEVLVPARGLYRVLIEEKSGDVWAVDRQDPLGRTLRLLMSDIQEFEKERRTATRRVLLDADGSRQTVLEDVELRLETP